jgi:hypothetical protein
MALILKTVPPAQGLGWVRDGFRLFGRHPLAFSALLLAFLLWAFVVSMLPLVGPLLMLASLPLLSLGFMVATEDGLADRPVHAGAFIRPLRGPVARRRSLLALCGGYAAATLAVMALSDGLDGGAFEQLQRLVAEGRPNAEIDALMGDSRVAEGLALRLALIGLLTVPYWHALALVHWGGQTPAQALFSSTLALWRSKGAFALYTVAWGVLIVLFSVTVGALSAAAGSRELAGFLVLPGVLVFSTAFYVSLLFTFNDSFGPSAIAPSQSAQA